MILRIELVVYVINYDNHFYLVNTPLTHPGGGTPLFRLYGYVRRQRVWFSAVFSEIGYQF